MKCSPRLFLLLIALIPLMTRAAGAVSITREADPDVLQLTQLLAKYGEKLCSEHGCYYIGPLVQTYVEYTAPNGEEKRIPATYQVELRVSQDGKLRDLLAQMRGVAPERPNELVPDVTYFTDRGADGVLDAIVNTPFFAGTTLTGQLEVSSFQYGCWDRGFEPFCAEPISDENLKGLHLIYGFLLNQVLSQYEKALALTTSQQR